MSCVFCNIVSGSVEALKIWESDRFLAFLDMNTDMPGHTLAIPKKHQENAFTLERSEFLALMAATHEVAQLIQTKTGCERVMEKIIGIHVSHIHVHVWPWHASKLAGLDRQAIWQLFN